MVVFRSGRDVVGVVRIVVFRCGRDVVDVEVFFFPSPVLVRVVQAADRPLLDRSARAPGGGLAHRLPLVLRGSVRPEVLAAHSRSATAGIDRPGTVATRARRTRTAEAT